MKKLGVLFAILSLFFVTACSVFTFPQQTLTNYTTDNTTTVSTNNYRVSFDSVGGNQVSDIMVEEGKTPTLPVPTKDGYTFIGWFTGEGQDGTQFSDITPVFSDVLLSARWTINQYTLSFESNGGTSVAEIHQDYGAIITVPEEPSKTGHAFDGWYTDSSLTSLYSFSTIPNENIIVYAKWLVNSYQLAFMANEEIVHSETLSFGTSLRDYPLPTPSLLPGYTFLNWSMDLPSTMPANDITIQAVFQKNTYQIQFKTDSFTSYQTITVEHGSICTIPADPERTGFSFEGWYEDRTFQDRFDFAQTIDENLYLYAKWIPLHYSIAYVTFNDQFIDPSSFTYQAELILPNQPTKAGHTFLGWFEEETYQTPMTRDIMPAINLTLYAKWKINQVQIQFETNGGTPIQPMAVDYGSTLPAQNPTKTGYEFIGWFEDTQFLTLFDPQTIIEKDLLLYAKWQVSEFTITFYSSDETVYHTLRQAYLSEFTFPTPPTQTGYSFEGWYLDPQKTQPLNWQTIPAKDQAVYAKWQILSYQVSFDSDGGEAIEPISVEYNSLLPGLNPITKTGHTFEGWYLDQERTIPYDWQSPVKADFMLYSKWEIASYNLIFYGFEGEILHQDQQTFGTSLTAYSYPTGEEVTGYTFLGFEPLPTFMPAADVHVQAIYQIKTYTIHFDSFGGSAVEDQTAEYHHRVTKPTDPIRVGHTFLGWVPAGEEAFFDFDSMISTNLNFVAKWEVNKYTLTFVEEDDQIISSLQLPYGSPLDEILIPAAKAKPGHSFLGWNTELPSSMPAFDFALKATYELYFTYAVENNQVTITGVITPDLVLLEVPASVLGLPVASIQAKAFQDLVLVEEIILPNSLQFIGEEVFRGCTSLKRIQIPFAGQSRTATDELGHFGYFFGKTEQVNTYSANGYYLPNTLTRVIITDTAKIGEFAFFQVTSVQEIILPENLLYIEPSAFGSMASLTSILIPRLVSTIFSSSFANTVSLQSFEVDALNTHFAAFQGSLFTKDMSEFIAYPIGNPRTTYTMPNAVKKIRGMAFSQAVHLQELILSNTLEYIESHAFFGMTGITSLVIPASVSTLTNAILNNVPNLESLTIANFMVLANIFGGQQYPNSYMANQNYVPNALKHVTIHGADRLYENALKGLVSIETITIDEGLTNIGRFAFQGLSKLTTLVIPDSVTWIDANAFDGCSGLTSLQLPFVGISKTSTGSSAHFGVIFGMSSYPGSYNARGYSIPSGLTSLVVRKATSIGASAFSGVTSLQSIQLNEGITSIGNQAFLDMTALESLNLPNSVTSIGSKAFQNASKLTNFTLPNSLTTLGTEAFRETTSLTAFQLSGSNNTFAIQEGVLFSKDLTTLIAYPNGNTQAEYHIPAGVTRVESFAFAESRFLTTIYFPETLTQLGTGCFVNTASLTAFVVPDFHNAFFAEEGILYNNLKTVLIAYPIGKTGSSYSVSSTIATISAYAFANSANLTALSLPTSVQTIEQYALYGMTALGKLTLPYLGLTRSSLGTAAHLGVIFGGINYPDSYLASSYYLPKSLKEVVLTDTTSIWESAFANVRYVEKVTLPNTLKTINAKAFSNCTGLTELVVPNSVTTIAFGALEHANHLTSLTLPFVGTNRTATNNSAYFGYIFGSLAQEGSYYANGYAIPNSLVRVVLTDTTTIPNQAFANVRSVNQLVLPWTLISIGYQSFANMVNLTQITLPDSLKTIGAQAFSGAHGITIMGIPYQVREIGADAFANMNSLLNIYVSMQNNNFKDLNGILFNKSATILLKYPQARLDPTYAMPNTVQTITAYAFDQVSALTSLTLPDSLLTIGEGAFRDMTNLSTLQLPKNLSSFDPLALQGNISLTSILVDAENPYFFSSDGVLFNKTQTELILYPANKPETTYIVPDSVETIKAMAFAHASQLTILVLPESLILIEYHAFLGLDQVTEMVIPIGVQTMQNSLFSGMSRLVRLTIPFVGANRNASGSSGTLTYLFGTQPFADAYEVLGYYLPTSLEEVEITDATQLTGGAFKDVSHVKKIVLGDSLQTIGISAFEGMSGLEEIVLSNSLTSIGKNAFLGTRSLTTLLLPYSITTIQSYTFAGANGLIEIEIPSSVTTIGAYAFADASSLERVVIPNSVGSIGESAFAGTIHLQSITLPFAGASRTPYTNQSHFGYIFGRNFYEDMMQANGYYLPTTLTEVILTNGSKIYNSAFIEVSQVTSLLLPDTISIIEAYAFSGMSSLQHFILPPNVTILNEGVLENAVSLQSITLHDRLTAIRQGALSGTTSLEEIILPASLTSIGQGSFRNMNKVTQLVIPGSVTSIGQNAFAGMTSLQTLTTPFLGNTRTSTGTSATLHYFFGSTNTALHYLAFGVYLPNALREVILTEGTILAENAFHSASKIEKITLPNTLETIGARAFYDNTHLVDIIIPSGVTSIGIDAFFGVESIQN